MNSSLPLTTGNKFQGAEDYINQANDLLPQVNPSPELTAMMTKNLQRRSSNLPLAIGSMLSRDKGVQNFGDQIYDDANDAMNPMALGDEGFIDPESGQFIASPIGETRRKERVLQMSLRAMQGNKTPDPYYTPIMTGSGVASFNNRTGTTDLALDAKGSPIIPLAADPQTQGAVAGARAGAKVTAEFKANELVDAPKSIRDGEYLMKLVDGVMNHPGREVATGTSRIFGIQNIPGTNAKSFDIALNQIKGAQFLEAFKALKGGGAITEVEGVKATQAISRMDAANDEGEFLEAAKEFREIVQAAVDRSKKVSGVSGQPSASEQPNEDVGLTPEEQRELAELRAGGAK